MNRAIPLRSPDSGGPDSGAPAGVHHQTPTTKIQPFEQKLGRRHEDQWNRTPNTPGTGAIHCKTFHCKLSDDALGFLDQQINEWLDSHPQYEVKFIASEIGEWSGKLGRESHLVVQVWV